MSLLNKIKNLLSRRRPAQTPDNDHGDGTPVSEVPAAPALVNSRDEGSGLKNSIARGAAEGAARETVRKFFEELFND